jgi:hypothetical protein
MTSIFLGGEPFLIELNPDCNVSITTNGTVFTEKVKRVLQKLNCQIEFWMRALRRTAGQSGQVPPRSQGAGPGGK